MRKHCTSAERTDTEKLFLKSVCVCVCVGKADGSDAGLHTALFWTVFGVTAVVLDIRATVTVHP